MAPPLHMAVVLLGVRWGRGSHHGKYADYLPGYVSGRMQDKVVLRDRCIELHLHRKWKSGKMIAHSIGRLYEMGGIRESYADNLCKRPVPQSNHDTARTLAEGIENISWMWEVLPVL